MEHKDAALFNDLVNRRKAVIVSQPKTNHVIIAHLYQQFASADFEEIKHLLAKDVEWEQMIWFNWRTVVADITTVEKHVFAAGYYEGT